MTALAIGCAVALFVIAVLTTIVLLERGEGEDAWSDHDEDWP